MHSEGLSHEVAEQKRQGLLAEKAEDDPDSPAKRRKHEQLQGIGTIDERLGSAEAFHQCHPVAVPV